MREIFLRMVFRERPEKFPYACHRLEPCVVKDRPVTVFNRLPIVFQNLSGERFLALEIVVERPLRDTCGRSDVLYSAPIEPSVVHNFTSHRQQSGTHFKVGGAWHLYSVSA